MTRAVHWLPDSCLENRRVANPLERLIADWSSKWTTVGSWRALGLWRRSSPEDGEWSSLRDGPGASLQGAPGAVLQLALTILGEESRVNFTKRDLKFLRRLAGHALDDLQARLDTLFPRADDELTAERGSEWVLDLGPGLEPLLRASVSRARLCAFARTAFPRLPHGPLDPRTSAAAEVAVSVAAHLGSAKLGVAQLEALEIGDVIVFDRHVDEGALLLIAERPSPFACRIAEQNARISLQLVDPD